MHHPKGLAVLDLRKSNVIFERGFIARSLIGWFLAILVHLELKHIIF